METSESETESVQSAAPSGPIRESLRDPYKPPQFRLLKCNNVNFSDTNWITMSYRIFCFRDLFYLLTFNSVIKDKRHR